MPSDNDLHKASHKGDLEECKRLIEEPSPGDDPIDVNEPGASDRRAIHRAAGAGHLDIWCVIKKSDFTMYYNLFQVNI